MQETEINQDLSQAEEEQRRLNLLKLRAIKNYIAKSVLASDDYLEEEVLDQENQPNYKNKTSNFSQDNNLDDDRDIEESNYYEDNDKNKSNRNFNRKNLLRKKQRKYALSKKTAPSATNKFMAQRGIAGGSRTAAIQTAERAAAGTAMRSAEGAAVRVAAGTAARTAAVASLGAEATAATGGLALPIAVVVTVVSAIGIKRTLKIIFFVLIALLIWNFLMTILTVSMITLMGQTILAPLTLATSLISSAVGAVSGALNSVASLFK